MTREETKHVIAGSRSRRANVLHGLQGVRLVHSSSANELRSIRSEASILDDFRCQEIVDNQRLIFKSENIHNPQDFRPWDQFPLKRFWEQRPTWLRMSVSPDHGDSHFFERVANVLTSIPFILIGLQTPRKKLVTKLYANSVVGVGLASSFYHCSRGDARKFFRWGDYTMIAVSSLCLSRALRRDNHRALIMASVVLLPFQPMLVTAVHTALMEATFVQRVHVEPQLRTSHALHAASSFIGCTLFVADDVFPKTPYLHAAWHLAAAIGLASCNKLLE